jgi:hypothetical protein
VHGLGEMIFLLLDRRCRSMLPARGRARRPSSARSDADERASRRFSRLAAVCALLAAPWTARADSDDFWETLRTRAKELAKSEYVARPTNDMPDWLAKLDYDGYRRLRFRPETTLWAGDGLPFRMQFMHRGYIFRQKAEISVIDGASVRELRFSPKQFDYGENAGKPVPDELGCSGFALRYPLADPAALDAHLSFTAARPIDDPIAEHELQGLLLKCRLHGPQSLNDVEQRKLLLVPQALKELLESEPALRK